MPTTSTRMLLMLGLALPLAACADEGEAAGAGSASGGARFFLPTGEPDNTSAPTVELDKRGAMHLVYPAYAGGDAYYGYCAPGCDESKDVKVVAFSTEGTVHNAMIALDGAGRPQILLATGQKVYYATVSGDDFARASAWTTTEILDHHGDREVTGEAFTLDAQGRPRFMMHTYKAYLGVGQKPPQAFYVSCDGGACHEPGGWKIAKVADQMWRHSTLRYDANGVLKLLTVATIGAGQYSSGTATAAYVECARDCDDEASWKGTGLMPVFELDVEAIALTPSLSMALTRSGAPRVIVLGMQDYNRKLTYFSCDHDCTGENWKGSVLSDLVKINVGLDLALDANDRPRFVHTLDYNIALAYCDQADCAAPDAKWDMTKVEYGGDIPKDTIFLWENCTVAAWFLHSPSLALTADGQARVGYQARDISGGFQQPDPTKPRCVAGTDMTWSRVAVMSSVK